MLKLVRRPLLPVSKSELATPIGEYIESTFTRYRPTRKSLETCPTLFYENGPGFTTKMEPRIVAKNKEIVLPQVFVKTGSNNPKTVIQISHSLDDFNASKFINKIRKNLRTVNVHETVHNKFMVSRYWDGLVIFESDISPKLDTDILSKIRRSLSTI